MQVFQIYLGIYDEESVEKAESFVLKCASLLTDKSLFWLAFQTNALSDITTSNASFGESIMKMKNNLKDNGFHLARLSTNMRNCCEVASIKVSPVGASFKLQMGVEHLNSATYGAIPNLIPLNNRNTNSRFKDVLREALSLESFDRSILLIHDGRIFDSNEIANILATFKTEKVFTFDPDLQEEDISKLQFEQFLSHTYDAVLISHQDYVTGIEACNVIYVMQGNSNVDAMLRCTLLRAVQSLCIIDVFSDSSFYLSSLSGFRLNSSYIECTNTFSSNQYGLICKDCTEYMKKALMRKEDGEEVDAFEEKFTICFDCSFDCHQGHVFEFDFNVINKECLCKNKRCKIA